MVLTNSGSVARDHLAGERTFLAYVRTSIAITSMGVALVQLFKLSTEPSTAAHRYARPLGAVIVVVGLMTLLIGIVRYFSTQRTLLEGKFPAARYTITFISLTLGAVTCVVFGILVGVASAT
ncbi:hypothetical protein PUNSTDRAFT_61368 [Punctularia strigosozonata HHB-11173 SS5]|uniref:uncharacterized protein n=1 Tax=Punctularia strigosozonata (strain HHB-11173) TaxID=741275 RepID=UPI0004418229|nr:uncharacterized protein PUNSTDRAFT_61368 [Punctularia strigosozonata HHB-11173 SS5]EIN12482.1 hypothetical protein PUNSTDRAFT_61368 [Punctularia strigosozonata HHB-11173 SS5]